MAEETAIPIYTLGYGGRSLEDLVALLKQHRVACLVDVRSAPYSRFRPEFCKPALETALPQRGLRYVFLGAELGGRPEDPGCYTGGKIDYDRVREREFFRNGVERLERARARGLRLALMCSEGRPEACHRARLIGPALAERGIPLAHIDSEGALLTQDEVVSRRMGGQLNLFADSSFRASGTEPPDGGTR